MNDPSTIFSALKYISESDFQSESETDKIDFDQQGNGWM